MLVSERGRVLSKSWLKERAEHAEKLILESIYEDLHLCYMVQIIWIRHRFYSRLANELSGSLYEGYPSDPVNYAADLMMLKSGYSRRKIVVPKHPAPIAENTVSFVEFNFGFFPGGRPALPGSGKVPVFVGDLMKRGNLSVDAAVSSMLEKFRAGGN